MTPTSGRSRVLLTTAAMAALFATFAAPAARAADDNYNVCIRDDDVDHTNIVDDQTILFVMRNHTVYRNRLQAKCYGLKHDPEGFTYQPTDPGARELCSNSQPIRTNTYHQTCLLGAFEKLPAGSKG